MAMKFCYIRYALNGAKTSKGMRIALLILTLPLMGAVFVWIFVTSAVDGLKAHLKEYKDFRLSECK